MSVEYTLCVFSNTVRFGPIRLNNLCIAELRECRVRRHCRNCISNYIRSCWSVGLVPCSTGRSQAIIFVHVGDLSQKAMDLVLLSETFRTHDL